MSNFTTTLRIIDGYHAPDEGYTKLLKYLGKYDDDRPDNEELSLETIYEATGVKFTLFALRCVYESKEVEYARIRLYNVLMHAGLRLLKELVEEGDYQNFKVGYLLHTIAFAHREALESVEGNSLYSLPYWLERLFVECLGVDEESPEVARLNEVLESTFDTELRQLIAAE